MNQTVHTLLQAPTPCGEVAASSSTPPHKVLHTSTSNKIWPHQYVHVLKKEIAAYEANVKDKQPSKGYKKVHDEWEKARVDEINKHASWHVVMDARGQGAGEALIGLLDDVLIDVLPSWVTKPLPMGVGSLCEYMCKHEIICLVKGECFTKSLCFPFALTKANKGNKHPLYLTKGKGKGCPSYLKLCLGVLEAKPTPKWRFEGVHVLLCYAMHGAPKVMLNGERQEVCHTCSHAWCLNPHHLKWGTHGDNMRAHWAAKKKGREKGMKEKRQERMKGTKA